MAQTASTTQKNIVILGGSYGGVSIAHYLLKHAIPVLPDKETYQVVLISASAQVLCRPACPRALITDDAFPQDKLFVGIPETFGRLYPEGSFRFVHGAATRLDHVGRTVAVSLSTTPTAGSAAASEPTIEDIPYYALVIATGASTPSPLLGLSSHHDAAFLRASWAAFRRALPLARSIVVAGGGPAGVETAGELGEFLNGRARGLFGVRSHMANPKVAITLVSSGPRLLPALRPSIAAAAETYLSQVGVTVLKNAKVTGVIPAGAGGTDDDLEKVAAGPVTVSIESATAGDGSSGSRELHADLYIPATGTRPNTSFVSPDLLAPDGRVRTNPATLRVDVDNTAGPRVYAIGDAASAARPAVHLILAAVPVLGANMKRDLLLAVGVDGADARVIKKDREFKEDRRETQLVPVGRSKGVGAAMGWRLPSFLVWLIKGRDYWLWTTGPLWSGKQWDKEA